MDVRIMCRGPLERKNLPVALCGFERPGKRSSRTRSGASQVVSRVGERLPRQER
jgi:hypothetical protein